MAGRLSTNQKKEMAEAYREGKSMAELAEDYGCSLNTVSRTVKSVLAPDEYETIKANRNKIKSSRKSSYN